MNKPFSLDQRFSRAELKQPDYQNFVKSIEKKLNAYNLFKWNKHKFKKYIDDKNFNNYLAYIFELFDDWLTINERFHGPFLMDLNTLMEKFEMRKYMTKKESNYIEYLLNIIFAKNRLLKELIVDFALLPKTKTYDSEKVYFNYSVAKVTQEYEERFIYKDLLINSEIFLTTRRIVISNDDEYISIFYKDVISVNLKSNHLEINMKKRKFKIYSFDLHLIYISLERIGKRLSIYF